MTDRLHGLTVTLDRDYRTDDAEAIINAIRQIRGVLDVSPIVTNLEDHLARERVRYELQNKLYDALKKEPTKIPAITRAEQLAAAHDGVE